MNVPHGSLVIFHLPYRVFLGIIYWNLYPVCCKHSQSERPRLCRPFHKHRRSSICRIEQWWRIQCVSSKEALYLHVYHTELGQSQTPAVWITLWIFVSSAHLTDRNLFGCFFLSLLVEWIVVSIYKEVIHHWCNISRGKQNSFYLSC